MRKQIILLLLFCCHEAIANDTLLIDVFSTPYFYNIIELDNEDLLVGTSEGVFKLQENNLEFYKEGEGYIRFFDGVIQTSTFSSEERDQTFNHLLPASYRPYKTTHFIRGDFIYIICKGILYTFRVDSYDLFRRGSSIRCFTENGVGTYNGIFLYDDLLNLPTYTSGNILEEDSTFFICYDGLAVHKLGNETVFYVRESTGETRVAEKNIGFARDIKKLKNHQFLLSTTKGVFLIDSAFEDLEVVMNTTSGFAPTLVELVEDEFGWYYSFANESGLYRYSLKSKESITLFEFDHPVVDAVRLSDKTETKYAVLTENAVVFYNYSYGIDEVISEVSDAYNIREFSDRELIITSLNGLYLVDLPTKETTQILKNIEFNKRAIWLDEDSLKLGTVNGYIQMTRGQVRELVDKEIKLLSEREVKSDLTLPGVLGFFVVLFGWLAFMRRKPKVAIEEEKQLGRDSLLDFIEENLASVTIKSMTSHFDVSSKIVYEILQPDKPGKLISYLRKKRAKDLKQRGVSIDEISKQTGFSVSYLKKVKS